MRAPRTLGLLLALALCALAPAAAGASYDPVAQGKTKLALDKSLISFLKSEGVTLTAQAPAKLKANVLTLPVTGGKEDPEALKAELAHEGALLFHSKRAKVPLRAIELLTKRVPLQAKVGGSQLKVAKAKTIAPKRSGFGMSLATKGLAFFPTAATRLEKKLGLKRGALNGRALGKSTSSAQPQTIALLDKGKASFSLDPAFTAKLASMFVSVNPIFPAEGGAGFSFPIGVDGAIAPNAATGTLRAKGGLEFLQLGAGQVFWQEPWVELETATVSFELETQPSPPYPGKQGRQAILSLGALASVSSEPGQRTIELAGAPLALSQLAADAFNAAFAQGKGAFAAGETVGVLGFGAWGR